MKSNKLALLAIALWVMTIAVAAWFFVRGSTTAGTDNRTAVVMKPGERDFVMKEMRGLLSSTNEIIEGINQGDMGKVIRSSRAAGMGGAADVNPALMAKLPLPFKQLAMSMHHEMDDIAKAAESGKPAPELLKMLNDTLSKCVACHASWQIEAKD